MRIGDEIKARYPECTVENPGVALTTLRDAYSNTEVVLLDLSYIPPIKSLEAWNAAKEAAILIPMGW